jgi:transposase InsO family protein
LVNIWIFATLRDLIRVSTGEHPTGLTSTKLHLFVAIDRTSKFAFVQLHGQADRPTAVVFLEALLQIVPYRLHTILTDNGIQFADQPRNRNGWTARYRVHRFDQICNENGIEHRLTKPRHPRTNG